MITLLDIAECLADILGTEEVYAGVIDGNKDKCIGVYNAKTSVPYRLAIGGRECTKTKEKHITLLIHHTDNPTLAETQAITVIQALEAIRGYEYECGEIKCVFSDEPVFIGRDERGICEYTINARIFYEESEE